MKKNRIYSLLFLFCCISSYCCANTYFYYGNFPIKKPLYHCELLIITPTKQVHVSQIKQETDCKKVIAYISVGEVSKQANYFNLIDKSLVIGQNDTWESYIINISDIRWQEFLFSELLSDAYKDGYDGFFLDTLDSYKNLPSNKLLADKYKQSLINIIININTIYPSKLLMANRNFDIAANICNRINYFVIESLFYTYDHAINEYAKLHSSDSDWLLSKIADLKNQCEKPIVVLDYLPLNNCKKVDNLKKEIRKLDLIPAVSDINLISLHCNSKDNYNE